MTRRRARPALRLASLLGAFALVLVVVAGRLVQLQVVRAEPLELLGAKQRVRTVELPAKRGSIYDRNRAPLAISAEARAVYVDPRRIENPAAAAATLAPLLGVQPGELIERLTRNTGFAYLARKVPPETARRITAQDLPYIGTHREARRVYPSGSLAGQILGFVGTDDIGLSGLESKYDRFLAGTPGRAVLEQDPNGRPIPQGKSSLVEPIPGKSLVLTIDQDLQFFAEAVLMRGVRRTSAADGVAIVLDARTAEVLAMANYPPLNPNDFSDAPAARIRNRALTDAYEPGSVNKVITAAAAIEEGIESPESRIVIPGGLRVADKTFRDYEPHGTWRLTYAEALARSSNIATIKVALKLGRAKVDAAIRRFGLGTPTGIGFPAESAGVVLPLKEWSGTSIGTIPIGQGIAATALQVASVYATLANDGVRVQPSLIRGTVSADGSYTPSRKPLRTRVVSPFTAAQVRTMLVGVVEHGTGKRARIPGYLVGGKTGTARTPLVGRLGYSNDIITTFAGFAPADDPRVVVLVALTKPFPRFSSVTAGPVFREILQFTLGRLGVPPTVLFSEGNLTKKKARRR